MNRFSQLAKTTALAAALLVAPLAFGIDVPKGVESTALVGSSAFSAPGLTVSPTLTNYETRAAAGLPGMNKFLAENGEGWEVRFDSRNNRPHLIQGQGIAILPGKANKLTKADVGVSFRSEIQLADVERALRGFMEKNADLLGIAGLDLRLDRERSVSYGGYYWTVEFQQFYNGIPVEDAHVFFRINNGNIIQFGVNRVADVNIDSAPRVSADEALAAATERIGLRTSVAGSRATLKIFPVAAEGENVYGERFDGEAGRGYEHILAYEHIFTAKGSDEPFRTITDAQSGRVIDFRSELVFAQVTANIYPVTNTDPLVNVGMPYTNVTNGTAKVTDASGNYTYGSGTATASLNGKYFKMTDNCGAISLSDSSTGNLAFGGAGGTDCTTPGVGGAGNTHSSRSGFYHLTNINRKAATFLPSNTWLASTVTANMNINNTCNAFWNGSTVNFYRSGGGCSNTGEIAAVFLHEWGHGMDTNSGGAASDQGSGEAVGDTFAFLETKDACIGKNFLPGSPCANCTSSCTGVRDMAAFSNGGGSVIAKPSNVTNNSGINCDRWACPYTGYAGPMGYEGHCESYIASTSNWDLQKELNTALGNPAGWAKMDQIWYGSLTASKSAYRVASGGTCNTAATVDGCAASNWYTVYLSVDDDNGNLADGTPNGCRIWSAFNAHGIACGAQPACSGGGGGGNTAPSVTITSPSSGSSYTSGASVSFSGTATDVQDGTLTSSLSWSSSINGSIGSGGSFSTSSLSVGTHTITASVTDSGSLTGSASITVNINAATGVLTNGVPVTGLSGATGASLFYTMAVPSGASNLTFNTSGGSGDADLYVRFGSQPTTSTYDCASTSATSTESCSFASPSTGTYYVLVYAYSTISGVSLTGSYTTGGGGGTPVTVTLYSVGSQDGRLGESSETSNVGGFVNSTDNTTSSLRLGDFSDDTQYKSLVSFDTSSIPDTATITAVTLSLKRGTSSGTNPFTTHGTCTVDMSNAFGGSTSIAASDFEAAASASGVASMSNVTSNGSFSNGTLNATGLAAINKTGTTQFKVYFTTDDNDDLGSDYIGFYSGESSTANRPKLVITYTP